MTSEEYREHCEEIGCFGLKLSESFGGVCLPLKLVGAGRPTVDECLKCHFRKRHAEQTNGVVYPFRKPRVSTRAAEAAGLFPAPRRSKGVDLLATSAELVDFSYCEGCRFLSGCGNNQMCVYRLEKGTKRPCRKGECKDYGVYERPTQKLTGWSKVHAKQWDAHLKRQAKESDDALLSWEPDEDDTFDAVKRLLDALAEEKTMEERT